MSKRAMLKPAGPFFKGIWVIMHVEPKIIKAKLKSYLKEHRDLTLEPIFMLPNMPKTGLATSD